MRLTPANWWTFSVGAVFILWLAFPTFRVPLSVILAGHAAVLYRGIFSIQSQFFGRVLCRNRARPGSIALTFDDGPDPNLTPEVLDLLDKYDAKATFFVVAQKAKEYPDIVQRAYRAGHTVACHDLHHGILSNLRVGKSLVTEIGLAQAMIQSVINARPLIYRPPMGFLNPHVLPAVAEFGMRCVGWSKSPEELGNRRRKAIGRIGDQAAGGEVVLLHDALPKPALKELYLRSLEELLESCRAKHLATETVDRFFGIPPYQGAMDARSQGISD